MRDNKWGYGDIERVQYHDWRYSDGGPVTNAPANGNWRCCDSGSAPSAPANGGWR